MYYEIFMSSEQEDGFIVKGGTIEEAVVKTIKHARKKHPGLFDENGNVREEGFPIVWEISAWQ